MQPLAGVPCECMKGEVVKVEWATHNFKEDVGDSLNSSLMQCRPGNMHQALPKSPLDKVWFTTDILDISQIPTFQPLTLQIEQFHPIGRKVMILKSGAFSKMRRSGMPRRRVEDQERVLWAELCLCPERTSSSTPFTAVLHLGRLRIFGSSEDQLAG